MFTKSDWIKALRESRDCSAILMPSVLFPNRLKPRAIQQHRRLIAPHRAPTRSDDHSEPDQLRNDHHLRLGEHLSRASAAAGRSQLRRRRECVEALSTQLRMKCVPTAPSAIAPLPADQRRPNDSVGELLTTRRWPRPGSACARFGSHRRASVLCCPSSCR